MESILSKLTGGDRCSIGRSNEVVADVLNDPALFDELFNAILNDDPIIRMRAADALEKITADQAGWLQPYKHRLIHDVAAIDQQEVSWHVAQMLPRLRLERDELDEVFHILLNYTQAKSSIVRTFAMQAMVEITEHDADRRTQVLSMMEALIYEGTPAMKARGEKLLEKMKREKPGNEQHVS